MLGTGTGGLGNKKGLIIKDGFSKTMNDTKLHHNLRESTPNNSNSRLGNNFGHYMNSHSQNPPISAPNHSKPPIIKKEKNLGEGQDKKMMFNNFSHDFATKKSPITGTTFRTGNKDQNNGKNIYNIDV